MYEKNKGFTLIELLVVLAIIAILSTLGIMEFINYDRYQKVNNAAAGVATALASAKSRADSQLKPDTSECSTRKLTLQGYDVVIDTSITPNGYYIRPNCPDPGDSTFVPSKIADEQYLPANISFDTTTLPPAKITFKTLTGGADGVAPSGSKIIITGYNKQFSKTITVYSDGRINFDTH